MSRKPTHADQAALYEDVKKYGTFTGLCWLLSPESPKVSILPMPSIEEILYSEELKLEETNNSWTVWFAEFN